MEDNPPNERKTLPPIDVVDSRMVALSLSSMATTLEQIGAAVSVIPDLTRAIQVLERQHVATLDAIAEAKGIANLAGSMADEALRDAETIRASCERIEEAVGKLALSIQGIDERGKSLYAAVFPEREQDSPSTPPDIELADVVPLHRRHVMVGE